MSTGKRLAKRSIIGTRVCAQGIDGLWYCGVISKVDTPSHSRENNNCINLTPNTKYTVRFDSKQDMNRRGPKREFYESELIGPGFRTIMDVSLRNGQKIFITYNGRESAAEVINHDVAKDEVAVSVKLLGYETPLELKKRLEEVRLLESRRSARLADQDRDTDFARLADMGGDRRRASHSIDVPLTITSSSTHVSRKRRPSFSHDDIYGYIDDDPMDECNAALVLMSLSCSPHSPHGGKWNTVLGSSPGSSSTASWSTGSSSPPLSDDGKSTDGRFRTSSISTSDEGIVMDYSEEMPRKRRANGPIFKCTWKGCGVLYTTVNQIETHIRKTHLGPKKPRQSIDDDDGSFSDSDHEEEFYYTEIEDEAEENSPSPPTLSHRDMARPPHEDPEYQRQIVGGYRQELLNLTNSPTIARSAPTQQQPKPPPQQPQQPQQQPQLQQHLPTLPQIKQEQQIAVTVNHPISISNTHPQLAHHSYSWSQQSPSSPQKHIRLSPRPSTSYAPYPSPTYSSTAQQNLTNTFIATTHHHQQQQQIQQQHHHHTLATSANVFAAQQKHHPNSNHQQHHQHNILLSPTTSITSSPTSVIHLTTSSPITSSPTSSLSSSSSSSSLSAGGLPTSLSGIIHHHQQQQQQQHHNHHLTGINGPAAKHSPLSPNRRTRGENKKCRKVYGMDNKDQWCTQCKWKKACSRFGD